MDTPHALTVPAHGTKAFRFALAVITSIIALAAPFLAFQKKLLPKSLGCIVGRLYFWPTIPLTYLRSWQTDRCMYTKIDETVLLGVAPLAVFGLGPEQLHALGVRGVVNMQDENNGPVEGYAKVGIKQLRLPTVDHIEPTVTSLAKAVEFIEEHRARKEFVYLHCKAGHGRAGAVALAWMAFSRKQLNEEDLEALNKELLKMRRVRKHLYIQPNVLAYVSSMREAMSCGSNSINSTDAAVSGHCKQIPR